MNIAQTRWMLFAFLTVTAFTGCGEPELEPVVTLHSFAVGTFDPNGKFTATSVIPYSVGGQFGYQLEIHSTSGKVQIREVLDLPEAGVWSDDDTSSPGITVSEQFVTEEGTRHVEDFEITCGEKMARVRQPYEIIEGDPDGMYKFTIYIDGELAEIEAFEVRKTK